LTHLGKGKAKKRPCKQLEGLHRHVSACRPNQRREQPKIRKLQLHNFVRTSGSPCVVKIIERVHPHLVGKLNTMDEVEATPVAGWHWGYMEREEFEGASCRL